METLIYAAVVHADSAKSWKIECFLPMEDEIGFDLLGDPIPPGFGTRGRPQHVPTKSHRETVVIALAQGWANERIAAALGITSKTLRKHYARELKTREIARDRVELISMHTLFSLGRAGNVSAMKEYLHRHDEAAARDFDEAVRRQDLARRPGRESEDEKPAKLGKKEQLNADAQTPTDGWNKLLN